MESRVTSSLRPDDGPDFLEFVINEVSVDDERDFMFPISGHEKQNKNDEKPNARERIKKQDNAVNKEQKRGENHGQEDTPKININTTMATEGQKKYNKEQESKRCLESSSRELENNDTILSASLKCTTRSPFLLRDRPRDNMKPGKTSKMRLRLSDESGAKLKERVLSELSPNVKIRSSVQSVQKYYWPFLPNPPYKTEDKWREKKQKQPALYESATNFSALKKDENTDLLIHSAQTKTLVSSSHRKYASLWVHNSFCVKKNQLPPIDSLRYSDEWIPENSVPSRNNVEVSASQINDMRSKEDFALKAISETLKTIQLGQLSRKELLKHSLPAAGQGKKQAIRLKRKALPGIKSSLSFKNYRNYLS